MTIIKSKQVRTACHAAGLLLSASLPAMAVAQTTSYSGPRAAIDGNGVDLISGAYTLSAVSISVGGSNGLSWSQGRDDLWAAGIGKEYNGATGKNELTVVVGSMRTVFVQNVTTYTPKEVDGSSLTLGGTLYTYKSASGDVVTFLKTDTKTVVDTKGREALPIDLTNPNGRKTAFTYRKIAVTVEGPEGFVKRTYFRLQSLSALTYQIHAAYAADTATDVVGLATWTQLTRLTALDGAVNACALDATSCATTVVWPRIDFNSNGSLTDAAGRVTSVTNSYDGPTAIRYPGSSADDVTITYSGGKVASLIGSGVTTGYTYADNGDTRTTTVTRGSLPARVTAFRLSTRQILREQWKTETAGPTYTRSYDYAPDGNDPAGTLLKRITEPEGNYQRFSYDARGNVTETRLVSKTPGTPPDLVTGATYLGTCDATNALYCNQPTTTTDTRGQVTNYSYAPAHGGVTSVKGPAPDPANPTLRPELRYSYAQLGSNGAASGTGTWVPTATSACITTTSCAGGADERRTTIVYGAGLNVASLTTAAGDGSISTTIAVAYDSRGNAIAVDGPLPGSGDTVRTRYDVLRRPTGTTGPDPDGAGALLPRATRTTYNADGTIQTVEQGTDTTPAATDFNGFTSLRQVTSTYDGYHRKVKDVVTAGGQTWAVGQQSYDGLSRLDCTVTRMDPGQWSGQPDACLPQTTGSNGPDRVTRQTYDAGGRPSAMTSAYGTAAASTETTGYTIAGRTATVTDANGNTTAYAYDGFDRPWRTCFQTASSAACATSPGDYEQTSYAVNGDVQSVRLRDNRAVASGYDGLGRRKTTTFANPVDLTDSNVTYSYDLLGQLTLAQDGNGHKTGYVYDALGRTLSETGVWGTLSSQYDAGGRRTRLTWGDGFFVNYGYDITGAMTTIVENTGQSLATYEYDNLGRRTRRLLGNGTSTTYGFDAASQLTALNLNGGNQPNGTTFTRNPAGQIASRTASNDAYAFSGHYNADRAYGVNGLNQYTSSGSVVPTYDAKGNMTGAGGAAYLYNSKNQLSGANGTYLYYDPAGRLDQVTQSGLAWEWDGSALVTERSGGAIVKRYVHGAGVDEPILWYEGSGTGNRRWLDADERGSIVRVTNDAGTAVAVNTYDEYGIPGAGNVGRFQYTGQMWMPELGFYHYKARMYSPTLGRFMQTDPIGYGDGLNLYGYVGGDPVNSTDPSGLMRQVCKLVDQSYDASNGDRVVTSINVCHYEPEPSDFARWLPRQDPVPRSPWINPTPRYLVPTPPPQNGDANRDGLLSREEANAHYRNGAGAPLTVDASKLKFRILADRGNGLYLGQSIGYSQFETYGKVDLIKSGSSWFVLPNTYDFDIKGGLGNLARDGATLLGWGSATNYTFRGGTAYDIKFQGSPQVFCQKSSRRC